MAPTAPKSPREERPPAQKKTRRAEEMEVTPNAHSFNQAISETPSRIKSSERHSDSPSGSRGRDMQPRTLFAPNSRETIPEEVPKIVPDAEDAFKNMRNANNNAMKARVRYNALNQQLSQESLPSWAFGLEQTPAHFLPEYRHMTSYIELLEKHAEERVAHISQNLQRYEVSQKNQAVALRESLGRYYREDIVPLTRILEQQDALLAKNEADLFTKTQQGIEKNNKTREELRKESLALHIGYYKITTPEEAKKREIEKAKKRRATSRARSRSRGPKNRRTESRGRNPEQQRHGSRSRDKSQQKRGRNQDSRQMSLNIDDLEAWLKTRQTVDKNKSKNKNKMISMNDLVKGINDLDCNTKINKKNKIYQGLYSFETYIQIQNMYDMVTYLENINIEFWIELETLRREIEIEKAKSTKNSNKNSLNIDRKLRYSKGTGSRNIQVLSSNINKNTIPSKYETGSQSNGSRMTSTTKSEDIELLPIKKHSVKNRTGSQSTTQTGSRMTSQAARDEHQTPNENRNCNNNNDSSTCLLCGYHGNETSIDNTKSVVNLSNYDLNEHEVSLLSRGLSFCPTQANIDMGSVSKDLADFHRRLLCTNFFKELNEEMNENTTTGSNPTTSAEPGFEHKKFKEKSHWTPPTNPKLDSFITANNNDLSKPKYHGLNYTKSNVTPEEKLALRKLSNNPDLVIKAADKGSAIVIQNREDYVKEGERQLGDSKYYQSMTEDLTSKHAEEIKNYVLKMHQNKEITEKTMEFLNPEGCRTPEFYMLPKIHKGKTPPPGRPIISGNNGPTERISKFVDHFLQPCVPKIKSYVKDTKHFLNILKEINEIPEGAILATLDVSSLYTNIPTIEGLRAATKLLSKHISRDENTPSITSIINLLKFVLTMNNFKFDGKHYLQIGGTAMGTSVAPSYANCFMGEWEDTHVYTYPLQPLLWKRYIDDIFIIWTHGMEELNKFFSHLNECHETIKLTMEHSTSEVPFLDCNVYIKDNKIYTELYCKPTDSHNYLRFDSCHPKHVTRGIPYSQLLRVRRICSETHRFRDHGKMLNSHFFRLGYPHKLVHEAMEKVLQLDRNDLLSERAQSKENENFIAVTQYNPGTSPINEILRENWDILAQNSSTGWIYEKGYKVGYRRPKNLKDMLVRARLPPKNPERKRNQVQKGPCGNSNCRYCPRFNKTGWIYNSTGKKKFWTFTNFDCNSNNLVYCLKCKTCKAMYVGQTGNTLKERLRGHFYGITSGRETELLVPRHFNQQDHHGLDDIEIYVLGFVHLNSHTKDAKRARLSLEGSWQHRLNTIRPHGLNTLDEI